MSRCHAPPADRRPRAERTDDDFLTWNAADTRGRRQAFTDYTRRRLRTLDERFARRQQAPDRHVPVRGIDVLGGRAEVGEEVAATVEHEDVAGPVRETPEAHLAPGDDGDGLARVVYDVDELGVGLRHGASSKRPPTAASSSGVFTLVRLRAAPRTARISASLT